MEWDFRYLQGTFGDAGAREKFEKICLALVMKLYPGQAHSIRVERGDGGIDILVGDFSAPVRVFQCKYFLGKLDDSRRGQIRESFRTARDNPRFTMDNWTLLIPIDMSQDEQTWWSGWKQKQETRDLKLSYMGQAELLALLREHRLYDLYFDGSDKRQHYLTDPPGDADSSKVICREKELEDIVGQLRAGEKSILLMNGFGGVGKTALARLVFHTVQAEYDEVAWISYRGSLRQSLLASILLKEDIQDETARWNAIRAILNDGRKKLIVIDNADHEGEQNPQEDPDLRRLTGWPKTSVLVTSRLAALEGYQPYDIDFFAEDACVKLFYLHYKNDPPHAQRDAVKKLVKLAQYHTLTVELFAKGARREVDLNAYYERLRGGLDSVKREFAIGDMGKMATIEDHLRGLFVIQRRSDAEKETLRAFAVLPPEAGLTREEAETWFGLSEAVLERLADDGWLRWDDGRYAMHPLVRQIIRLDPVPEGTAGPFLDFIEDYHNGYFPKDMVYTELTRRLELAEAAVEAVCNGRDTAQTSHILHNLGDACRQLARYGDAAEHYSKALKISEAVFGPEHPDTATTYNNLALVYDAMGDYPKALEYNEKTLKIDEAVNGPEHPDTATTYNNLANVYYAMGDYPKALEYHEKARRIQEAVLGPEHPDTATTYNNLAGVYYAMGDYPKALEYHEKARRIREAVLGTEHPSTATSYNNLAIVYKAMGDYPKALEYYEKSLIIREAVLGPEHPDTATTYNNLATVYEDMGDYPKALEYYEKARVIREAVLGMEHPYTATTYIGLGNVFYAKGDYPQALEYYDKTLAIIKTVMGEQHPYVASTYNNLAIVYKAIGDYPKAQEYHEKARRIREAVLGPEHPGTATTWHNLSYVYLETRDIENALRYSDRALAVFQHVLGPEHPYTTDTKQFNDYLHKLSTQ